MSIFYSHLAILKDVFRSSEIYDWEIVGDFRRVFFAVWRVLLTLCAAKIAKSASGVFCRRRVGEFRRIGGVRRIGEKTRRLAVWGTTLAPYYF